MVESAFFSFRSSSYTSESSRRSFDIMTLFPETVGDMMNESILGRAQERGYIRIDAHQISTHSSMNRSSMPS